MKIFGLTGGVGMGKSTAAEILRDRGVPVVDTDEIAHQLVQPNQPALAEILEAFGKTMVDAKGHLRRDDLARIVFANPVDRKKLEKILHPRIREVWLAQIEAWRAQGHNLAVVVIPLLFETQAEIFFDKIICVACSVSSQNERLLARGWNSNQIRQRNAAQWPVQQKIDRADLAIWTEGSAVVHQQQWEKFLKRG